MKLIELVKLNQVEYKIDCLLNNYIDLRINTTVITIDHLISTIPDRSMLFIHQECCDLEAF